MSGYLIKDTTKEERIALIRSWQEPDDCVGGSGMDLFDMYDAYIRGEKEIAEINGEFQASYVKDTEDLEQPEEAKSTSGELFCSGKMGVYCRSQGHDYIWTLYGGGAGLLWLGCTAEV